jgi:NADH-quinone oxidoreductase subunit F
MPVERLLTRNWGKPGVTSLEGYEKAGGYRALRKALEMQPAQVIDEVKRSNLRGRGGAGFSTGTKWGFLPKGVKPVYLCVNADESEPGTFKDRACIENDPHQILEGIIISCWAIGCHTAYIYTRGEFKQQSAILERAIEEAYEAGLLGKRVAGKDFALDVYVHRGAGAYICGEETALLESLEGKKGWPRLKPPFPAVVGLFGAPTIINNVETMASVPLVIEMGAEAYAKLGTERSGGTRLISVSGHVNKPGVYEVTMHTTFREIVYDICGGIPGGRGLKAVIPGGSSCPVLGPDEIDVPAEFEALKKADSMAGSGGVVVMDDSTCMVRALWRITRFYAEESCGQCTPCREGMPWMSRLLRRIEEGRGSEADLKMLRSVARAIAPFPPLGLGTTICALGDAGAVPVQSFLDHFPDEFEAHVREKRCPFPHPFGELAGQFVA